MNDPTLSALALLELVQRLGSTDPLAEHAALAGGTCEHHIACLYLCGIVVQIAEHTGYPLQPLIDHERADALTEPEPPGGFA